jgi:hypothetical protein
MLWKTTFNSEDIDLTACGCAKIMADRESPDGQSPDHYEVHGLIVVVQPDKSVSR